MEAVPRLPMISFELKTSPEYVDFGPVLKQYIRDNYGEDPANYNKACSDLEQLRQSAVHVSHDFMGCSTLKKYYAQLQFLQGRFPMTEGGQAAMPFTWEDIFMAREVTLADIKFEQASVLYNIGSLHSILGAMETRTNADSMKVACTHFQCAAGAFEYLRDHFGSAMMSHDFTHDLLTFHINLMLAQAQECILEKSMIDSRKSSITAKVAAQIVEFDSLSIKSLEPAHKEGIVPSRRYKEWKKRIELKSEFYECITNFYMGKQSEEQQKWGECLAYYTVSFNKLNECIKQGKNDSSDIIQESFRFAMDVIGGKYQAAKKDNDFVYHEKIPDASTLPEVKGAALVKGITFNPSDPEVSGPDLFQKLVPMEAHEASSLYSEEKANLLRRVCGEIEEKNAELIQFMSSLNLDQNSLNYEPDKLPQSLLEKCAQVSVKPNAIKDLVDAMTAVSNVATDVDMALKEITELLENDTKEEEDFQKQFGTRSKNPMFENINKELNMFNEGHRKGSQSNSDLHKAMHAHITNLRLLGGPIEDIKNALPSKEKERTSDDDVIIKELQRMLSKVEEMKNQRSMLEEQFRKDIQNDDITQSIVIQEGANKQVIFDKELQKHQKQTQLIQQNLAAQDNILRALTDTNVKYAHIRRMTTDVAARREVMIQDLMNSFDVYEDLLAKSQKGQEFYRKLESNVSRLLTRCRALCKIQAEEREQIINRFKPKVPPPRPAAPKPENTLPDTPKETGINPATVSTEPDIPTIPTLTTIPGFEGPKLKDYLPFMKPKTFGKDSEQSKRVTSLPGSHSGSPVPSLSGTGSLPESPSHTPGIDVLMRGGLKPQNSSVLAYPGAQNLNSMYQIPANQMPVSVSHDSGVPVESVTANIPHLPTSSNLESQSYNRARPGAQGGLPQNPQLTMTGSLPHLPSQSAIEPHNAAAGMRPKVPGPQISGRAQSASPVMGQQLPQQGYQPVTPASQYPHQMPPMQQYPPSQSPEPSQNQMPPVSSMPDTSRGCSYPGGRSNVVQNQQLPVSSMNQFAEQNPNVNIGLLKPVGQYVTNASSANDISITNISHSTQQNTGMNQPGRSAIMYGQNMASQLQQPSTQQQGMNMSQGQLPPQTVLTTASQQGLQNAQSGQLTSQNMSAQYQYQGQINQPQHNIMGQGHLPPPQGQFYGSIPTNQQSQSVPVTSSIHMGGQQTAVSNYQVPGPQQYCGPSQSYTGHPGQVKTNTTNQGTPRQASPALQTSTYIPSAQLPTLTQGQTQPLSGYAGHQISSNEGSRQGMPDQFKAGQQLSYGSQQFIPTQGQSGQQFMSGQGMPNQVQTGQQNMSNQSHAGQQGVSYQGQTGQQALTNQNFHDQNIRSQIGAIQQVPSSSQTLPTQGYSQQVPSSSQTLPTQGYSQQVPSSSQTLPTQGYTQVSSTSSSQPYSGGQNASPYHQVSQQSYSLQGSQLQGQTSVPNRNTPDMPVTQQGAPISSSSQNYQHQQFVGQIVQTPVVSSQHQYYHQQHGQGQNYQSQQGIGPTVQTSVPSASQNSYYTTQQGTSQSSQVGIGQTVQQQKGPTAQTSLSSTPQIPYYTPQHEVGTMAIASNSQQQNLPSQNTNQYNQHAGLSNYQQQQSNLNRQTPQQQPVRPTSSQVPGAINQPQQTVQPQKQYYQQQITNRPTFPSPTAQNYQSAKLAFQQQGNQMPGSINQQQPVNQMPGSVNQQQPVNQMPGSVNQQQPVNQMPGSVNQQQLGNQMPGLVNQQQTLNHLCQNQQLPGRTPHNYQQIRPVGSQGQNYPQHYQPPINQQQITSGGYQQFQQPPQSTSVSNYQNVQTSHVPVHGQIQNSKLQNEHGNQEHFKRDEMEVNLPSPLQPVAISTLQSDLPEQTTSTSSSASLDTLSPKHISLQSHGTYQKTHHRTDSTTSNTSLDDILSTSPSVPRDDSIDSMLTPKVLTAQEIEQQKEEAVMKYNMSRQSSKDPFSDPLVKDRFVGEVEKLAKYVESLTKPTCSGPTHLDLAWKELVDEQERGGKKTSMAIARCYPAKNREQDSMPYDENRVILTTLKDDYINASLIADLSPSCPKFISTQSPLPVTVTDFWAMVYEQGSEVIVMLTSEAEKGKKYPEYWPQQKGRIEYHGAITLTIQSVKDKGNWFERIIYLNHNEKKQARTIVQLQYKNWPISGFPENISYVLQFITEVHSFYRQQRSLLKPVIVHCSDGIGRTGIFMLVYTCMQDIDHGRGISGIQEVAKMMFRQRRLAIKEKYQLKYAYEAILYYAQDILAKEGILIRKASFGDKLPQPGEKSNLWTPTEDILFGSSISVNALRSNVAKMGLHIVEPSTEETVQNVTKTDSEIVKSHLSENLPDVVQRTDGNKSKCQLVSQEISEEQGHLHSETGYSSPKMVHSSSNSSLKSAESVSHKSLDSESIKSLESVPNSKEGSPFHQAGKSKQLSLADLQNPQTFDLGTSEGKKKITKASFYEKTSSLCESDPTDPLSSLDPLWSLNKDK